VLSLPPDAASSDTPALLSAGPVAGQRHCVCWWVHGGCGALAIAGIIPPTLRAFGGAASRRRCGVLPHFWGGLLTPATLLPLS
jgi:hypothetical protein